MARIAGFRYDAVRDAYVLRLVGNRLGPVLRTAPHDSAAEAIEWPRELREIEERRLREGIASRRFARDQPQPAPEPPQDPLRR